MKILHIIGGDLGGGAARGAYWLHQGLLELGCRSKILTTSATVPNDNDIVSLYQDRTSRFKQKVRYHLDGKLALFYRHRKKIIFSTGLVGFDFTNTDVYKQADILHLHWINSGFINIKHLSKVDKPVVWTLRDMWPMTGGCHYAIECDNYKTGCGSCPQLGSRFKYDVSRFIINRKKKFLPRDMRLVGISHWLSDKARKSLLFRDYDIRTIHNNVNAELFSPVDSLIAKDILGLRTRKKIILAGAQSLSDFYKGFDKYLSSLRLLDTKKYFLVFFGNLNALSVQELGYEYKDYGFLNHSIPLKLLYSAADVFVAPSIMEAFGKTIVEAMSCKTPVVCFNATGPKEIVTHQVDGYKARPFDPADLAQGIKWVLEDEKRYYRLAQCAREKVVEQFSVDKIAKQYKSLYEKLL